MTPTISVAGLTRRYRGQVALDDVTVDIEGPCITGLLGRNGAGKSTLMRIIANQEFASAGGVRFDCQNASLWLRLFLLQS